MPQTILSRRCWPAYMLTLAFYALTGPAAAYTPTATTHTAEQQTPHDTLNPHQAWNLTTEEWQRFEELMERPKESQTLAVNTSRRPATPAKRNKPKIFCRKP